MIGEEKHRESTKKFTKVGATNDDLGPGTVSENTFCEGGGEGVLQKSVKVESHSVTREEPCEVVERPHDTHDDRTAAYKQTCGS